MTHASVHEYAAALRRRYQSASKAERGRLLTEFCTTTGYQRKAAIRLLAHEPPPSRGRPGRPRQYGPEVVAALVTVWEASDRACGKRLAPFLPELVARLEQQGALVVSSAVQGQLVRLSAATVDRLLAGARPHGLRRPWTHGGSRAALRALIPVRTSSEWADVLPGAVQADLVAHCGETTEGFHLWTLTVVDVATSWTECEPVWGKGRIQVTQALVRIRSRLPFALRELHTDNGSEFLNDQLAPYCRREGIRQTRGRPYRKNDQAWVEQKNGAVVRRLVGYDRYASRRAYQQLGRVYALAGRYQNFFAPVRKPTSKQRVGARVVKRYDVAQTPYQRLLGAGVLDVAEQQTLAQAYARLDPLGLRRRIDAGLEALWPLAAHASFVPEAADREPAGQ
jgi:hypothetical protein